MHLRNKENLSQSVYSRLDEYIFDWLKLKWLFKYFFLLPLTSKAVGSNTSIKIAVAESLIKAEQVLEKEISEEVLDSGNVSLKA